MNSYLAFAGLVALATAQVPHGGAPRSFSESIAVKTKMVTVKPVENITALVQEDSSNKTRKDEAGGLRIGVLVDVAAPISQFQSDKLADGTTVYRLAVRSPEAVGMGINFAKYQLPVGAQLFVYSGDRKMVRGSFTEWNHKPGGDFAVAPVPGDMIVVEVVVPASVTEAPVVEIGTVVHHFRPTRLTQSLKTTTEVERADTRTRRGFGDSGACNVNVKCPLGKGYEDVSKASAMILTSSGSRICSGSMINNVEQDGKQYFLSAEHCGTNNANNWIFVFNYESAGCENPRDEPSTADSVQGSRLVAENGNSDFGLLELIERIPPAYGVYLAGFDATDVNSFTEPFSIAHPSGDIKKVAYYGGMATAEGYFSPGETHWLIAEWDKGVTERGSSGSPILDTFGRIRGQLHGGYADCSYLYTDYYGRISQSWDVGTGATNQLALHLDPQRTGTRVVDGGFLASIQAEHAAKSL